MSDSELIDQTISELAPRIKAREVSPVEVAEAALAQVERLQPTLNSFITILHEQAMDQAKHEEEALARGEYKGPLHGIPIGIKDNIAIANVRATLGAKALADNVPDEDAHVVTLCRQAGAVILGKENMEEFAGGSTSNNQHYGAVHNPWDLNRIPGGSSGGGGANVASSVTFASLGSDLGGSVRGPGHFCGVVGLKQTFGRVSQRGLLVTSFNGDHIGPMTRSVEDSALVLQAISGFDPLDPSTVPVPVPDYTASLKENVRGLRMGIPTDYYFDLLDPEVEGLVRQAIVALQELGVEAKDVALPSMKYAGALRAVGMADNLVTHEPYIRSNRADYGPHVLYLTLAGQFVLGSDYSRAMKVQRLIKEEYSRVLQEVDFLATPTGVVPAWPIEDETVSVGGTEYPVRGPGAGFTARNTGPSNATGLPAISVPCGFTRSGLPVGLQLIGRAFEEGLLFQAAHAYEQATEWHTMRPPV